MASGSGVKRKTITLETKLEVIKKHNNNIRTVDIANHLGLAESTVRSIIKNKDAILAAGKSAMPLHAKTVSYMRSPLMINMEKLLNIFIEDNSQRRIPMSTLIIREKARNLYERLKPNYNAEDIEQFSASKGWFENFKKRSYLHSILIQGEAASANYADAEKFKTDLLTIMSQGGYTAQQLFNVDETGLFWKRMPKRTFISREEKHMPGYKVGKDRFTLLLGGNATGDCKLKPLLVYKSENPRAFKGVDKEKLPVHWTSNSKAWVTRIIFLNWYKNCFGQEVETFCQKHNLAHNVILLLDNAPGHPPADELHAVNPHVQVVYLPPNTSALIQPMDQGLIATFKSYYLRQTFSQAVTATNDESAACDLRQFWKNFNILDSVRNVGEAWKEVKEKTLAGVWKKVYEGGDDGTECNENVTDEIIELGKVVGLDLEKNDIDELLESDKQPLDDEGLIAMGAEVQLSVDNIGGGEDGELQTGDNSEQQPSTSNYMADGLTLNAKGLREAFEHLENFYNYIKVCDPETERSVKVINGIKNQVNCYRMLLDELKRPAKQAKLDVFFKKPKME